MRVSHSFLLLVCSTNRKATKLIVYFYRKKFDHAKIVFIDNMIFFSFKILSNKLCGGGRGCCSVFLLNLETCPSEQVDLLFGFIPSTTKPRALLT